MEENSKIINEQQSNQTDYSILLGTISVAIMMLLCVLVYLVAEDILDITETTCQNINCFLERTKLILIFLLSSIFWLVPILYRNKKESKIYKIADLLKFSISMLALPIWMVYAVSCP